MPQLSTRHSIQPLARSPDGHVIRSSICTVPTGNSARGGATGTTYSTKSAAVPGVALEAWTRSILLARMARSIQRPPQGAGGVHHVAFRTPTEDEYHAWAQRLNEMRIPNSGEVDRYYFRSLYFREPNGVLFELATDGPGFATDEPEETLGQRLALPPFLEPQRARIEANLKPLG